MPDKQTKQEKFERIAPGRVNRAIKAIRLVGNLANRKAYEYDESQALQIEVALKNELILLSDKFAEPESINHPEFAFGREVHPLADENQPGGRDEEGDSDATADA